MKTTKKEYQPKTGAKCTCKRGIMRDNCATCEGTGFVIDFKKIREKNKPKFLTIEQAMKAGSDGKNQDIKSQFVGREVFCNVNSLVEYCLSKGHEDSESPVNIDEIENFYSYPEYIGKHIQFDGGSEAQKDLALSELDEKMSLLDDGSDNFNQDLYDEMRDERAELETLENEPQEVFEWWAVSSFLFDKLRDMGYVVIDTGSCKVWGRTTTGQAILLDYVITRICAEMEILEGQANSWAKD